MESIEAEHRGGSARSSAEVPVMGMERRGRHIQSVLVGNRKREELLEQTKPYEISKFKLWEAYQLVRRNGGAAGIDGMTLEKLAEKDKELLYKLWNRMSSGSYFPKAVRRVEIPKKSGGTRALGIPTVLDRVA